VALPAVGSGLSCTSLLPPLIAIVLALLLRQVIISLFAAVFLGALIAGGYNPFTALLRTVDQYLVQSLASPDHASIIIFTLLLGGMTGIISRAGGAGGVVRVLGRLARTARSCQLAVWAMGLVIFFDDYANSLLVGSSMRPLSDRLKVSREKLAYIVDSTSAPVASVAVFSTWIGAEVGLIRDAFVAAGHQGDAYIALLKSIPYRFYPLLTLAFGFMVAVSGRDFSSMWLAERRARSGGGLLRPGATPLWDMGSDELSPLENRPQRWVTAVVPVLAVLVTAFAGLYLDGSRSLLREGVTAHSFGAAIGAADSYRVLLWASLVGCLSAALMAFGQRILNLVETMEAMLSGARAMLTALVVLLLAWSLGQVCSDLGTADYILSLAGEAIDPRFLPALIFVIAGAVSFATGTSWGTMSILIPLAIPLAIKMSFAAGLSPEVSETILLGAISSVLAGSVFGDHCSPISDTTILSSMAASSDHIDHVRTQLPYALVVGATALVVGDIPSAFGLPPLVSLLAGVAVLALLIRVVGRRVE
jgi:Na+/H+ antiporter NhaC